MNPLVLVSRRTSAMLVMVLAAAWLSLTGLPAHATPFIPGTPDTEFNNNVGTTLDYRVNSIGVQADEKVVVAGEFTSGLARFNSDGTPDTAFNTNVGSLPGGYASAVAVQSDGKIVVGGDFSGHLSRFNSDGTPDTTFNLNVGSSLNGTVSALALTTDGKIAVGGSFSGHVRMFNSDGTSNSTFDSNIGSTLDSDVYALKLTPDDKVVVGGFSSGYLHRFNADGTPDTTFNSTVSGALDGAVFSLALQSNGKILAGGYFSGYLTRINSDGTPDNAFNGNIDAMVDGEVDAIALAQDGKIIVGGYFTSPGQYLARLTEAGDLDTDFDNNVGTELDEAVLAVTIQPDGKILAGGYFITPSNYLARFNGDPVGKTAQTITFGALADRGLTQGPVSLSASASSGLSVSFDSTTPGVCSVSGSSVTLLDVGTCTVRASQAGDADYDPAPDVDQSFVVLPVPNQPLDVSAVSSGDKAVTVSWGPPIPNGVTVTGYLVQASPGNRACATGRSRQYCVMSNLNAGQSYTFTVRANSANGYSQPATTPSPVVALGVPGAVSGLKAVAGDSQVTVRWTAPVNDGGMPITGYEMSVGGGSWQPAASPQLVTGLVNGVSASVRVRAVNVLGAGRALAVSATPFGVPSAPANLVLTRVSGTKVTVGFDPADGNGRAVSRYTVTAGSGGYTCSATKPSCTVTGLPPGTYTFTATATNAAGTGPASTPSSSITLP